MRKTALRRAQTLPDDAAFEKVYLSGSDYQVTVRLPGGTSYQLPHHVRHSPTGFCWGYGGSGPSDLARCILIDFAGEGIAERQYQDFKWAFVSGWPMDGHWVLSGSQIRAWLGQRGVTL